MTGKKIIEAHDNKINFTLEIERSVTVISGNSASGKTTLIDMLSDWESLGRRSGVHCRSNVKITVFNERTKWTRDLPELSDTVIFIDEGVDYATSFEFAAEFHKTNNYLVIITRSGKLKWFNFSIDSIKELVTEGKNVSLKSQYNIEPEECSPDLIITEDSNSGCEFVKSVFSCSVDSAYGNANVSSKLTNTDLTDHSTLVIVDAAAFGPFIKKTLIICKNKGCMLFAPESFEFLLLNTRVCSRYLQDELINTSDHCESRQYLSWERYYTALLDQVLFEHYRVHYSKSKLPELFRNDAILNEISALYPITPARQKTD